MRPLQLRVTVPLLAIHYSQMHVRQIPVLVEAGIRTHDAQIRINC